LIESRNTKLEWKVVKVEDIRGLAETFSGICTQFISNRLQMMPESERHYSIEYQVKTEDGSEFTSHESDMFKEHGVLDTRVIRSLALNFRTWGEESMRVELTDSNLMGYNGSEISVKGSDGTWVSGTFTKLLDCVDSWQDQNTMGRKWQWPIGLGITYLIGLAIVSLISLFPNTLESPLSSPSSAALPLCGLGFSGFVADYVESLWPKLEIVPAQEHEQKVQKRRGRLKYVLTAIVVPLIIAVIVSYLVR
jgi:hypothetical protein